MAIRVLKKAIMCMKRICIYKFFGISVWNIMLTVLLNLKMQIEKLCSERNVMDFAFRTRKKIFDLNIFFKYTYFPIQNWELNQNKLLWITWQFNLLNKLYIIYFHCNTNLLNLARTREYLKCSAAKINNLTKVTYRSVLFIEYLLNLSTN